MRCIDHMGQLSVPLKWLQSSMHTGSKCSYTAWWRCNTPQHLLLLLLPLGLHESVERTQCVRNQCVRPTCVMRSLK
jgi:hypothetical protein